MILVVWLVNFCIFGLRYLWLGYIKFIGNLVLILFRRIGNNCFFIMFLVIIVEVSNLILRLLRVVLWISVILFVDRCLLIEIFLFF